MGALEEFADYMVIQFFLPFRVSSVKTPQSTPISLSTIQASTPTGTKQCISVLRHNCLKASCEGQNCTDDDRKLLETEQYNNFQYLEVTHILSHCLTKVASGDKDLIKSKKNVLWILDMFNSGIIYLIHGPKINSPLNALTLMLDNHQLFGKFQIYFEPTGRAYEYRIHSTEGSFLSNAFFPVTHTLSLSLNHMIDLPSPQFLSIHHAISLILKLSGAAEYIEQTL
ncbi:hypothetical protein CIHG_07368 [Coccidioides immitis H538.4]|uniref:HNH nuclease domain-containing protein n=1 Tax=Coccidioides immitis H538.4 TaxID=396776 RepID=A0A0J8RY93_COCIT|nr:hypothetical protein CIHG_07368 [Coccidioides immitis H538.4]